MEQTKHASPLLAIWRHPAQTIIQLVHTNTRFWWRRIFVMMTIAECLFTYCFTFVLGTAGPDPTRTHIQVLLVLLMIAVNFMVLHIVTGCFWLGSKMVKGKAEFYQMRTAIAWHTLFLLPLGAFALIIQCACRWFSYLLPIGILGMIASAFYYCASFVCIYKITQKLSTLRALLGCVIGVLMLSCVGICFIAILHIYL